MTTLPGVSYSPLFSFFSKIGPAASRRFFRIFRCFFPLSPTSCGDRKKIHLHREGPHRGSTPNAHFAPSRASIPACLYPSPRKKAPLCSKGGHADCMTAARETALGQLPFRPTRAGRFARAGAHASSFAHLPQTRRPPGKKKPVPSAKQKVRNLTISDRLVRHQGLEPGTP